MCFLKKNTFYTQKKVIQLSLFFALFILKILSIKLTPAARRSHQIAWRLEFFHRNVQIITFLKFLNLFFGVTLQMTFSYDSLRFLRNLNGCNYCCKGKNLRKKREKNQSFLRHFFAREIKFPG